MIDDRLRALRDIIQVDVGNRGLARDPIDNLFAACPEDFANACKSIASHPSPRVGIVTGFMIPSVDPPTGETDGPPGALHLARVLNHLEIPSVLLSDASGYNALRVALDLLEPSPHIPLINLSLTLNAAAIMQVAGPLTHLVAIERSGPSHANGRNYTMRGRDITNLTAPAHLLFEETRNYVTIGIGDGGNEIGMGKIPLDTIRRNIANGESIACRTATDFLIVAGVSNWGAYALAAGVMLLKNAIDASLFDSTQEFKLLDELVRRGPLVDGVTGQRNSSVDGLSFADYVRPLLQIHDLLRATANGHA